MRGGGMYWLRRELTDAHIVCSPIMCGPDATRWVQSGLLKLAKGGSMVGISIKPPSKDLLRIVSYAVVNLMMVRQ